MSIFDNYFFRKFSIGGVRTKYTFRSFWRWAYYNVDTPLLRGVLVEYILVRTLIDNAATVVSNRISELTHDTPTQKALEKSLSPFYSYQPHGDLFDLQLHWGVTIEIKSTESLKGGYLHKTHWWGPLKKRDIGPKLFPAQYYILAELVTLEGSEHERGRRRKTELPEIRCYICRGRDIENEAKEAGNESFSYAKWRELAGASCSLSDLPASLGSLCNDDTVTLRRQKLKPDWKMPRPSFDGQPMHRDTGSVYVPIAYEDGTDMVLSWWDFTVEPKKLDPIPYPWRCGIKPDLRDWEAAGFKYERAPNSEQSDSAS